MFYLQFHISSFVTNNKVRSKYTKYMYKTSFFQRLVKTIRACLAFYLIYWAIQHFINPLYFQDFHKQIYTKFLSSAFKVLQLDPPDVQTFDGYWLKISQIIGLIQIVIALLYWKNQGFGSALTFVWAFGSMVISNFEVIRKTLTLLQMMDIDTMQLPISILLLLIITAEYIEGLYLKIEKIVKKILKYIWQHIKKHTKYEKDAKKQRNRGSLKNVTRGTPQITKKKKTQNNYRNQRDDSINQVKKKKKKNNKNL